MLRQALKPSEPLREVLAETWAFRAHGELEAADRFQRLARTLGKADARVCAMASEAAEDERRHAVLCAELACYFGAKVELCPENSVPVGYTELDTAECTLAEVVSLSCIAESLSVAALTTIRECAVATDVRDVVHEILKDEVKHARLGWAHLFAESRRGRSPFLSTFLPRMIAAGIPSDLFDGQADRGDDEALSFGQLSRARRLNILCETFVEVIFPGFEAAGVDTTAARLWLESRALRRKTS